MSAVIIKYASPVDIPDDIAFRIAIHFNKKELKVLTKVNTGWKAVANQLLPFVRTLQFANTILFPKLKDSTPILQELMPLFTLEKGIFGISKLFKNNVIALLIEVEETKLDNILTDGKNFSFHRKYVVAAQITQRWNGALKEKNIDKLLLVLEDAINVKFQYCLSLRLLQELPKDLPMTEEQKAKMHQLLVLMIETLLFRNIDKALSAAELLPETMRSKVLYKAPALLLEEDPKKALEICRSLTKENGCQLNALVRMRDKTQDLALKENLQEQINELQRSAIKDYLDKKDIPGLAIYMESIEDPILESAARLAISCKQPSVVFRGPKSKACQAPKQLCFVEAKAPPSSESIVSSLLDFFFKH